LSFLGDLTAVFDRLWGGIKVSVGCIGGTASWWFLRAASWILNKGRASKLTPGMKSVFGPFFPNLDLDEVGVSVGATIVGPGDLQGMTLGYTIYLSQADVDECNVDDMELLMHELVHVDQYRRIGWQSFGCMYGMGYTLGWNWDDIPLEQEAVQFVISNASALEVAVKSSCGNVVRATMRGSGDWAWLLWS